MSSCTLKDTTTKLSATGKLPSDCLPVYVHIYIYMCVCVCVSLLYALNCFYDFNVIISFSELFVHMIGACLYASLFIEQLRLLL